jgi:replicative DNA helicase
MITAPDAERAVIGSMLIERDAIAQCIDLDPARAVLGEEQNKAILRYIYDLFKAGKAVDLALRGRGG